MIDYREHIRQQLFNCITKPHLFREDFGVKQTKYTSVLFFHSKDDRDYNTKNKDFRDLCNEYGIKWYSHSKSEGQIVSGVEETRNYSMIYYITPLSVKPDKMEKELRRRISIEEVKMSKHQDEINRLNNSIAVIKSLKGDKQ